MGNQSTLVCGPNRILLVEGKEILREGLGSWLRQEFPQCRIDIAANREQAEQFVAKHRPAVALVDIDDREGVGLTVMGAFQSTIPDVQLVALSLYQHDFVHEQAVNAGAVACACIALADDSLRDLLRKLLPHTQAGTATA